MSNGLPGAASATGPDESDIAAPAHAAGPGRVPDIQVPDVDGTPLPLLPQTLLSSAGRRRRPGDRPQFRRELRPRRGVAGRGLRVGQVPELGSIDEIRAAAAGLDGVALRTPLVPYPRIGPRLLVKPESLQPTGSFKLRGAYT